MKVSTECLIVCALMGIMGIMLTPLYSIVGLFWFPTYFICRAIEDKK